MAYCVKCGVELERNLTACPLCNTPVYYREEADEEYRPYPDRSQRIRPRHVNLVPSKAFVYLMTFIIVIAPANTLNICCRNVSKAGNKMYIITYPLFTKL
jgi:hypothetical protein